MNRLRLALGGLMALPVTLVALPYVFLFTALKWYTYHGVEKNGFVFQVNVKKCPLWLLKLWKGWAGHAIGQIVVLKTPPGNEMWLVHLTHELQHVRQCMRLGVFQPIIYGLCMLAIKLGCPNSRPYKDCCFEIDARRAAGQAID